MRSDFSLNSYLYQKVLLASVCETYPIERVSRPTSFFHRSVDLASQTNKGLLKIKIQQLLLLLFSHIN